MCKGAITISPIYALGILLVLNTHFKKNCKLKLIYNIVLVSGV